MISAHKLRTEKAPVLSTLSVFIVTTVICYAGVDIDMRDNMSRTALHLAAWKGNPELVQLLLRSKASTLVKAKDNFSALHFATQSGSLRCCELLLEKNPKLLSESISKGQKKPLHMAASKNNFELCKLFLDKGADPTALTTTRQTALDFARDDRIFQLIKGSIEGKIAGSETAGKKRKARNESISRSMATLNNSSNSLSNEQAQFDEGNDEGKNHNIEAARNTGIYGKHLDEVGQIEEEKEEKGIYESKNSDAAVRDEKNENGQHKMSSVEGETVVVRKRKKQKVKTNISNLSCYDNDDVDDV